MRFKYWIKTKDASHKELCGILDGLGGEGQVRRRDALRTLTEAHPCGPTKIIVVDQDGDKWIYKVERD